MARKFSAFTDGLTNQSPTDTLVGLDLSQPASAQNTYWTLNSLFSEVTRNITDGALRFGGFSAPSVSAAGKGSIYFDGAVFQVSQNGGAYAPLGVGGGISAAVSGNLIRASSATTGTDSGIVSTQASNSVNSRYNVADYASLLAAVTALGSVNSCTLVIASDQAISSSFTVPTNITLEFTQTGKLSVANGVQITINGYVSASPGRQIFALTGTGNVLLTGNTSVYTYYAEWWGAIGNNVADDTVALQAAFDALPSSRTLRLLPGKTYRHTGLVFSFKFSATLMGLDSEAAPINVSEKPILKYVGVAGGTAFTASNVYSCKFQSFRVDTNSLADIGFYLTFTATGSPGITSHCLLSGLVISGAGARTAWIGLNIDNASGQNNEHHEISECFIQGTLADITSTAQTGIRQGHIQVKANVIRRTSIVNVGIALDLNGNVRGEYNSFSFCSIIYKAEALVESSSFIGSDIEQCRYYWVGVTQNGLVTLIGERVAGIYAGASSNGTATIQTAGSLTLIDCFFERITDTQLGPYLLGSTAPGNYFGVQFIDCGFYATTLNQMAQGFSECATTVYASGQTYVWGQSQFNIGDQYWMAPDRFFARRRTIELAGTSESSPATLDPLFVGDNAIGVAGLFMPNLPIITVVGTPGATTLQFSIIARDSMGRRSLSYAAATGNAFSVTTANATLDGTNYLTFTWPAQFPVPTDYQLYEVNPLNDSQWRLVATIIPSGNKVETYNLQANPAGAYTATRPSYNESGIVNFRAQTLYPNEVTFTANDTTPSVAIGNDFLTANSGATSITTFDDPTIGQVIRVRVNDTNTTFVNSATLVTGTGGNISAVNGKVYSFVYRASAWRLI